MNHESWTERILLLEDAPPDPGLAAHLEACAECRRTLAALRAFGSVLRAEPAAARDPAFVRAVMDRIPEEPAPAAWSAALADWLWAPAYGLAFAGLLMFFALPQRRAALDGDGLLALAADSADEPALSELFGVPEEDL